MSDPARRWKRLRPGTQWSVIFELLCDVRNRELKLAAWKGREAGGALNKTRAKIENAKARALLDLLRAATPPEVWADAEKAARRP